jgi:hypothetical protein
MILAQAEEIFGRALAPLPLTEFLDDSVGKRFIKVSSGSGENEKAYLGRDPAQTLLESFVRLAPKIGCHAAIPIGPPPTIEAVADVAAFADKIAAFHALGYTVRLPEIRSLTPELDSLIRAMEVVFHQPVKVEAFWSRGDARAPSHHDDYDILIVHLLGRKRWFISTRPSGLPNAWNKTPDNPSQLERFEEVPVGPGDVLYLPRGTTHRVDAVTDSIHLSIGFVPLTLREAIIACLDHLSDVNRPLRETVGTNLGARTQTPDFGNLPEQVRAGLRELVGHCETDAFVHESLQRRSARAITDLAKLRGPSGPVALSQFTRLRHSPLAACHLGTNAGRIDFAYPGGRHLIHAAVGESVSYIAHTPEFSIRDIPGAMGDDIRLALAEKFVLCGFLEVV